MDAHVTTGDKIKGGLKEGLGKLTGNDRLEHEGKEIKRAEKSEHKIEEQEQKAAKQHEKASSNAARAGITPTYDNSGEAHVGAWDRATGALKENVGGLIGSHSMEAEGRAVRKTEEHAQKQYKAEEKANDHAWDAREHKIQGGLRH
eukprot:TRINITY_DN83_c0_g1_i1.p2 TRINITY_DN83_c0_g1~~TRINITY_DN83_c0_g1_i1.p2  ORF type:complete len:146 (-),score=41.32 TRINITY_DN83_c0_g1_i1:156-593(-)